MARGTKEQAANAPAADTDVLIRRISDMSIVELRTEWRQVHGADAPSGLTKDLIARALTYRLQERALGGLSRSVARTLRELGKPDAEPRRQVKAGSIIVREYDGVLHEVMVVPGGFCWQGKTFDSLSTIAKAITGTNWNGPRFFGLRAKRPTEAGGGEANAPPAIMPKRGRRSSLADGSRVASEATP